MVPVLTMRAVTGYSLSREQVYVTARQAETQRKPGRDVQAFPAVQKHEESLDAMSRLSLVR